jgi:DNA-binding MarR family transcriptional regulator
MIIRLLSSYQKADIMPTAARASVGRALRVAHYAFRQAFQDELPAGLSLPLAGVLLRLEEEDGLSGAELARRETVTPQTMNQLVARLLDLGLVERRRHQTHGRILTLHLTRAGRRALERCMAIAADIEDRILDGFSAAERRALLAALHRCTQAATSFTAGERLSS